MLQSLFEMGSSLLGILPFVLLVGIHHFLLAPLLYKHKQTVLYVLLTLLLLAAFGFSRFHGRMTPPGEPPGPPPDLMEERPERPRDGREPFRPEAMELVVGILLIGGDLGLVAYRRMKENERRLKELQHENLTRQLETLRYQINPHFFMNTLNNIQSLVLTDPAKATEMISEFSKLMRIVLYEGDDPVIPLSREIEYLRHYLALMRVRYPDTVRIVSDFPDDTGDAVVPPLLLASFVENAFKHGISYKADSFIETSIGVRNARVVFRCANSRHGEAADADAGIGSENVRRRLELLYEPDYTLHIDEQPSRYDILLDIPSKPEITPA